MIWWMMVSLWCLATFLHNILHITSPKCMYENLLCPLSALNTMSRCILIHMLIQIKLLFSSGCCPVWIMSIRVTNLTPGETLNHSLALIFGEVTPPLSEASIVVRHQETSLTQAWPIFNGLFKVLLPLIQGVNNFQLLFYDEHLDFNLIYKVPPFVRFVRPVYIIAADDDGYFHGPEWEDSTPASAVERISFGAKLLQTFTAEKLAEHGLGRRNFVLETDLFPDRNTCHIFKSRLKLAAAHAMSGADLWIYFAKELMSSSLFDRKDHCKWFAFISFTRYCPPEGVIPKTHSEVLKYTKGHTALGEWANSYSYYLISLLFCVQ